MCIISIFTLSCCSTQKQKTYTVDTTNQYRTVICYGIVNCDKTVKVEIPNKARDIELHCAVGDTVAADDTIATYFIGSVKKSVIAESNGIVTKADGLKSIEYYDISAVKITSKISEADASLIKCGMAVKITGVGFDKQSYTGTVSKLYSIADVTASGAYLECDIKVDSPDFSMIPGFSARVEIEIPSEKQVLVPINSLQYDGDFYIYKMVNNQKEKVRVHNSTVCGEFCAVSGEIDVGDIVAVNTDE